MLAIADQANDDGDCWPGVRRLAGKCRLSERGLQKILAALQTAGELQVFLNEGTKTKTGFTNRYRVLGVNAGTSLEPEGVNPNLPVEVNASSPPDSEGVNTGTPPGVNASSPDPKEEPKENTEPTKAIASKPPTPQQAMFQAICEAWSLDMKTLTMTRKTGIGKVARELHGAGAIPAHIPDFKRWLDAKARDEKWNSMTEQVMAKYWPDYATFLRVMPVSTATPPPSLIAELRARKAIGENDHGR
jgi:hypothetical protein